MADVRLEGVHKRYGAIDILRNIDLDIGHGEFVVFVGPSGSGKSTLLRMIGGLERISGGRIFIDDQVVNNVDAADRNLGMVFQSYALYPHLSARENLAFPLRMAKLPKEQIRSKVGEVAELLHIEELLDRKPRQLSGGQRQRVAIGRAIVREPKVFLFDEPLSNLDTELRVQMRVQIAKLHRQIGNTMIYVTHDQVEAMTMADKIVVLRDGNIEQIGTPQELYHRPATQFVAGFIGSPRMNFLKCRLVRTGDSNCVVRLANDREATLPISPEGLTAGQPLVLGIRPDDFVEPSALPGGVLIDINVDFVEHLGNATYFYGIASGENVVARAPDRHRHVGAVRQLELAIAPRDCHLFTHDGRALQRLETPQSWS